MAHETTIHRVDVQAAAGATVTSVADDVALDGIDEALTLWFGHRLRMLGMSGTREGTVAVRVADRAWIARADRTSTEAYRVDAEPTAPADAEVSGSPEEVYLWLWGRLPTTSIEVTGDDDAVAQAWALLRLATR
jgi:hypothetical protein